MQSCLWLTSVCMTQGEWAAWAQAILSALAIFVAALFPSYVERAKTRRMIENYGSMMRVAWAAAHRDAGTIERSVGGASGIHWDEAKWDRLHSAFSVVPYHDLPDDRLFDLVHDAAEAVSNMREVWRGAVKVSKAGVGISPTLAKSAASNVRDLQAAHEGLEIVSNSYAPFAFARRIKFWWLLHKLRKATKSRSAHVG